MSRDGPGEYVVLDMTGRGQLRSGLITEPTGRGVSDYWKYLDFAQGYDAALRVIRRKVSAEADVQFLRRHVGQDLLASPTSIDQRPEAAGHNFGRDVDRYRALQEVVRNAVNVQTATA
ncbi:hypothetical protein [Actinospica robiniae]|uniref:hypothetical protein n=1 Tax=Actinospica robiniae TaxID=304901 RepID=UPI00054EFE14|nr:hypothetical protein [Actinospica robiniae]